MSVNAATLSLEIEVDDKGSIKVKQLGQAAEAAGNKGKKSFSAMGRTLEAFNTMASKAVTGVRGIGDHLLSLKGLLAGAGLGMLGQQFTQAASASEDYAERLARILGDQDKANTLFTKLGDYAGNVPYQYEQIMASATALAGVMDGGATEVMRWMPLIGDLAAASGLSIQESTDQIIRMYSAGAASADLFRERGVLAMLGFQAGVSYSAEETREQLMAAWEDPASKFKGATDDLKDNWTGLLSMMSDKWFQFRTDVMKSGPFLVMKEQLQQLLDYWNTSEGKMNLKTWALTTTDVVLASFRAMTLGAQTFSLAVEGWTHIFNVVKGTIADVIWYAVKLYEVLPKALVPDSWEVSQRKLEEYKSTALEMAIDVMDSTIKTLESGQRMADAFASARNMIDEARESINATATDTVQAGNAIVDVTAKATAGAEVLGTTMDDALVGGGEAMGELVEATEELVEAEEKAAGRVQSAWEAAMSAKGGDDASLTGPMSTPAAVAGGGSGMPLYATVAMPNQVTNNYTTYNQVNEAAEAERRAAEEAARAAEEARRQWESVANSYRSLLDNLRPFTSDLSLAEFQRGFGAALASVEAAEDFLQHLQYHSSQLQGYQSGFQTLLDNIQTSITNRQRSGWGATEWWAEYDRLADELADLNTSSEDYNERALELSESMLEALNSIDQAEAASLQELDSLRSSLLGVMGTADAAITSLLGSDLNPAQSMEFYTDTYAQLFQRAMNTMDASDVQTFVQFAQQSYLPFLQSYGGNYAGVFDSVIEDIESVKDAAGVDLLEGGIVGDLETIQTAVDALGLSSKTSAVFAEWLAERIDSGDGLSGSMTGATSAADTLGNTLSGTEVPMHNVTTKLEALANVTESNLSTVADQLTELVEGIAAAVEALENNSGTPIVVTPGGGGGTPQPQVSYDYNWRFVLEGHTPITGTGFTTYWGYWTTPHGGHVSDRWTTPGGNSSKPGGGYAYYAAEGGFATDRTLAGEDGDEWIIPVDKPKNRDFLRDIGLDDERMARAMAKAIGPMLRNRASDGDIVLKMDGRELARVMASQLSHNRDLVEAVRRTK